jgi:hypothetical protein
MNDFRMKILFFLICTRRSFVKGILVVFTISVFYSCVSLKKIGIEVAVLPEYPISEDIQSLALLNRSMTRNFSDNNPDTLERILVNNKMLMDTVFLDSIASDTVIRVAARALFKSGRFDAVIPKERNIARPENTELANPLKIGFINEICTDFKVDAVLVLENFAEKIDTRYYLRPGEGSFFDEYSAVSDVLYKSEWRLYRPDENKPVLRFQMCDSIFWKANSYSLEELYSRMPRTKEAIIGGGIAAGLKMAAYISPKWISQNRFYFLTGKQEIDSAAGLIKNNKWEEATVAWSKYTTVKSKVTRSKIEFNLALASEMTGNIDLAVEWALKSFKTRYTKAVEVYLKTLDNKRKALLNENSKRY